MDFMVYLVCHSLLELAVKVCIKKIETMLRCIGRRAQFLEISSILNSKLDTEKLVSPTKKLLIIRIYHHL